MKIAKLAENRYLIKLASGDEIINSLTQFAEKFPNRFVSISGIGAVSKATLSCYQIESLKYLDHSLEGDFEVASLIGNIATFEGKPIVHAHISIADKELKTYNGHLKQAVISITLEVTAEVFQIDIIRSKDDKFNINLIDLEDHGQSQPV